MAQHRKTKPKLKLALRAEAGGKCANPGCTARRTHVHHIKHWHVYKADNAADMIAICPTCHDNCHHGTLKITDELLYSWKHIKRADTPDTAQIFVDSSPDIKLLTGSIAFQSKNDEAVLFELSDKNWFKFRVEFGDTLQVSSQLQDYSGKPVFRVANNVVRASRDRDIRFEHPYAGRVRVTVPATSRYLPLWQIAQMQTVEPKFGSDGRMTALDLAVLEPGLLRVQGYWPVDVGTVVFTANLLCICHDESNKTPLNIRGEGKESTIIFDGKVTTSLFEFMFGAVRK